MDGIHDLGGMHGFGPIAREADAPLFHAEWEKRAFGIALQAADGVGFGDDHLRSHIERIPPQTYLRASYYELWLHAVEAILTERGILSAPEIAARMAAPKAPGHRAPGNGPSLDEVEAAVAAGASTRRPGVHIAARFHIGQAVRVKNDHPAHHTRVPRYVRARRGQVVAGHGVFVFPDSNAQDRGEQPQHCYTVKFAAEELWGAQARAGDSLCLDLWESYLEAA